jgi:hypothetical protein
VTISLSFAIIFIQVPSYIQTQELNQNQNNRVDHKPEYIKVILENPPIIEDNFDNRTLVPFVKEPTQLRAFMFLLLMCCPFNVTFPLNSTSVTSSKSKCFTLNIQA